MAVADRMLHLPGGADRPPDRALVRAAQEGHPEAAAALIERHYPRIRSFVSHFAGTHASAEDLTQEVFTRALASLGRFNGDYRFEHWLLRIARNLCIDEARREVRRPQPTDPADMPEPGGMPGADFVWDTISSGLVVSIVQRALAQLPPRQRTALVLKEIEGMSTADIARVVGVNPRGAETLLRRARARFRLEATRADSVEHDRAACRRTLGAIAADPDEAVLSPAAASHLRTCPDCRARSRSIRSADRAFALLPLAGIARPRVPRSPAGRLLERSRALMDLVRSGRQGALSPLAHAGEVFASVALAAALSVSPTGSRPAGTGGARTAVTPSLQAIEAGLPETEPLDAEAGGAPEGQDSSRLQAASAAGGAGELVEVPLPDEIDDVVAAAGDALPLPPVDPPPLPIDPPPPARPIAP